MYILIYLRSTAITRIIQPALFLMHFFFVKSFSRSTILIRTNAFWPTYLICSSTIYILAFQWYEHSYGPTLPGNRGCQAECDWWYEPCLQLILLPIGFPPTTSVPQNCLANHNSTNCKKGNERENWIVYKYIYSIHL